MCSHYEAPAPQRVADTFGVEPYEQGKLNLWPGYIGPFIRSAEHVDLEAESPASNEVLVGSFGLIPCWSKDTKIARKTYNCRSETASAKPSFRNAWRQARHCIHKPEDEKRMVIILPKGLYGDWLKAPTGESMEFMREYPADRMKVTM
ncbi:SOS response-associated peptidase family protein [Pseudomonas orientalis]|uniref:Abasic site processing protein n=1 Tax=Pseudomonas orientalis TaxID=76758 RepID=A0A4Q7CVR1_9PSED|nr:SOS response-associated peptidase family protein [Pseudomonas orientalis]RZI30376.1 hypothetical protein EUX57_17955 [Pseudomonas orientalis]